MKKIFLALCAGLVLSLGVVSAATQTRVTVQSKSLCGLHAGSTFTVTLRQNSDPAAAKAIITIDPRLEPYLERKIEDGVLTLGFKDLPRELQSAGKWSCPATAEVTVTGLKHLSTSGLANVKAEGSFSGRIDQISSSGNSRIGALDLTVPHDASFKIETSGLSSVSLTLHGGSRLNAEASGNSNQQLDFGSLESLEGSTSGLSHITATGSAQRVEAEASGNSGQSLVGVKAASVECSTSGLSKITCHPTRSLKAEASGNSRINYQGGAAGLQTNFDKSGMSSISAID